ncbi:MAG: DUF1854 domain-containing protein [Lachnospiraceae bacterium]|nr:DUF1854 domain-containing protein [Lachnospiraceae bacterium]
MEDNKNEEFSMEQMEEETKMMLRLRYLDSSNAHFERTKGGFVSLLVKTGEKQKNKGLYGQETTRIDGSDEVGNITEFYKRVNFFSGFPFTDPGRYISVREASEKAPEIGVIKDIEKDLDAESIKMVKEQLAIRYFTPVITKINNIKEQHGFAYWDVETKQGRCRFTIRLNSNSVIYLNDVRLLITDLDENRFEIPDYTRLSGRELKKLDLFL